MPLATAVVTSAMLALASQVAGHQVTLSVRSFQVPATPLTSALAAEFSSEADFARHTCHFEAKALS